MRVFQQPARTSAKSALGCSSFLNPFQPVAGRQFEICKHYLPPCQTSLEKIREKYNIPQSFFLYVGLIKPHKNVLRLLRVFNRLKEQSLIKSSLVLIGRKNKVYPKSHESLAELASTHDIRYPQRSSLKNLSFFTIRPMLIFSHLSTRVLD